MDNPQVKHHQIFMLKFNLLVTGSRLHGDEPLGKNDDGCFIEISSSSDDRDRT